MTRDFADTVSESVGTLGGCPLVQRVQLALPSSAFGSHQPFLCVLRRSEQETGCSIASATSSTTTWRRACPSSLLGVSSASSSRWRGTHDLPAPCPDAAPVVRRAQSFSVAGCGAAGPWGCPQAQSLVHKPQEEGSRKGKVHNLFRLFLCILEVYIPVHPVQSIPLYLYF